MPASLELSCMRRHAAEVDEMSGPMSREENLLDFAVDKRVPRKKRKHSTNSQPQGSTVTKTVTRALVYLPTRAAATAKQ